IGEDGAVVVGEPLTQPRQVDGDAEAQAGEDVPGDGDGDVGALGGGAAVELARGAVVAAARERGAIWLGGQVPAQAIVAAVLDLAAEIVGADADGERLEVDAAADEVAAGGVQEADPRAQG